MKPPNILRGLEVALKIEDTTDLNWNDQVMVYIDEEAFNEIVTIASDEIGQSPEDDSDEAWNAWAEVLQAHIDESDDELLRLLTDKVLMDGEPGQTNPTEIVTFIEAATARHRNPKDLSRTKKECGLHV